MSLFSDPHKIIDQCSIQAGMSIADFGSGSGFYAREAARSLASTGVVFAIDIQKDLLVKLKSSAQLDNLSNIEVIWGDIEKPEGSQLKENSVDLVLIANLLFQVENKKEVLEEAKRILVGGGRLLLVEWSESFGGIGPHTNHVFSQKNALELCTTLGFSKERDVDPGSHHYGMIMKKL